MYNLLINILADSKCEVPGERMMSGSCKCGTGKSCLGNSSANMCDAKNSICRCGKERKCSGIAPFCFGNTCVCSSEKEKFCQGNSTRMGTCIQENHVCSDMGICSGRCIMYTFSFKSDVIIVSIFLLPFKQLLLLQFKCYR